MEYVNCKNLLRKQIYSELDEEYENQLKKKGRKNDDQEAENDFIGWISNYYCTSYELRFRYELQVAL